MVPFFKFKLLSDTIIVVSGHELVAEVCDETRFDKSIEGALAKFVPLLETDYLLARLTSLTGKAHNILMPTFSQRQ